jgi:hypothetical protein
MLAAASDEARFFQDAQVFRDRGQRHRMWSREMHHATVALREMGQDPLPRGIGQCGERAIQHHRRMFNHLVNY